MSFRIQISDIDAVVADDRAIVPKKKSGSQPINRILCLAAILLLGYGSGAPALGQDPILDAATFSGANTRGRATCFASDGAIYVVGETQDPGLQNALNSLTGQSDMYVMKFSADLTTVHWSRYMGGSGQFSDDEIATDCAGTADGGVVVTGRTETSDFPTVDAMDTTLGGVADAVLFKLDEGGDIVFSTYIGGSGDENPFAAIGNFGSYLGEVELAGDGSIFLAGTTRSDDFPLVDPIQPTFGGFFPDAFLMKISADGQTILFSTYIGDEFTDVVWDMQLDAQDRPVLTGQAGPGWPETPGAFFHGNRNSSGIVHATKINTDIPAIEWVAWIERIGDTGGSFDFFDLSIAPDGTVTVAGRSGDNFPPMPADAFQPMVMSGSPTRDVFVLSFSGDGSTLTAGTYLGNINFGEFTVAADLDSFGQLVLCQNVEMSSTSPPRTRLFKFDPGLTTLLAGPITMAQPASSVDATVDHLNNLLVLIAGTGDTTPGAFSSDPEGAYRAYYDLQDPPAFILGDVNRDGVVNLLDVQPFVALLTSGQFQLEADINGDGLVNLLDVNGFIDLLTGN